MSEKKLWNRVRKYLPGIAERVENILDKGTPDVHGECHAGGYWVELKAPLTVSEPEDPADLLDPFQRAWFVRRLRYGARLFVIAQFKRHVAFYKASLVGQKLFLFDLWHKAGGAITRRDGQHLTNALITCLNARSNFHG